jgi:hypothetical protein
MNQTRLDLVILHTYNRMPWLLGSKKPVAPVAGKWVEDVHETNYGMGQIARNYLGTYHWEGPEPANGRPQNPAETPEGMARLQKIRNNKQAANAAEKSRWEREAKARADKAEESRVCKEACDAAVAELKARRASGASGGRRKTRKNRKRKQNRRKSYRR